MRKYVNKIVCENCENAGGLKIIKISGFFSR